MKTAITYLFSYLLMLLLERKVLSLLPPLVMASITFLFIFIILSYEGKNFSNYIKATQATIYSEYRRRSLSGNIWMQKYIRSNLRKGKSGNTELTYHCRRVFIVSRLVFPAFVSLLLAGLP